MGTSAAKSPLVQEAYDLLRQKIIRLELYPGQVVSDYILSKDLNMSRTPIKQALLELKSDGLIDDAPVGKGYIISKITPDEVRDIFDAREGIETMALKIAMERGLSQPELEELRALNEAMRPYDRDGNLKETFNYDNRMHSDLVRFSGNRRLIEFNSSLVMQINRLRFLTYFEVSRSGESILEHDRILNAIAQGNVELARQALAEHIRNTRESYVSVLQSNRLSGEWGGLVRFFINEVQ